MFVPLDRPKHAIPKKKRDPIIPDIKNVNYKDVQYMREIHSKYLKHVMCKNGKWINESELNLTILKCALEGAFVTIVDSKQSSYIGVSGIVLMELKNAFVICNEDGNKMILKRNIKMEMIFKYKDDEMIATLYGNGLINRGINKKYKPQNTIEFQ
eukprot:NODE_558_length_6080_cov_0.296773.p5 type:complete len:155 gc:universal NODE_558_length_6080_cov_0.296773:1806-2270(+)